MERSDQPTTLKEKNKIGGLIPLKNKTKKKVQYPKQCGIDGKTDKSMKQNREPQNRPT